MLASWPLNICKSAKGVIVTVEKWHLLHDIETHTSFFCGGYFVGNIIIKVTGAVGSTSRGARLCTAHLGIRLSCEASPRDRCGDGNGGRL